MAIELAATFLLPPELAGPLPAALYFVIPNYGNRNESKRQPFTAHAPSSGRLLCLTYAISWTIWLLMAALSLDIQTSLGRTLNIVAIFGPTVARVIFSSPGALWDVGRFRANYSGVANVASSGPALTPLRVLVTVLLVPRNPVLAQQIASERECEFLPWEVAYEYRETLPNATLLSIPNAGHALYGAQPELILAVMRAFLLDRPLPLPPYTASQAPARP